MRRRAITGLITMVLAMGLMVPTASAAPEAQQEWIVTLADGAQADNGPSIGSQAYGLAENAGGTVGHVYDTVLGGFSFTGSARAALALLANPTIASVTPVSEFELATVPTGVSRIDGDDLHAYASGAYKGDGVRIVVIDSGIDSDHPDLVGNLDIASGLNCDPGAASTDDDNSHGSHVAGTAAASAGGSLIGVAPEATLVPVKAFNSAGSATSAEVLCGINHAASLALDGVPTVVNMSFVETGTNSACGTEIDPVHEAICDLVDAGGIPVAAAGNSSINASTSFPAAFDETISVSALTDYNGVADASGECRVWNFIFQDCDDTRAPYSNFGATIDVMAPGTAIESTVPGGGLGEKSGTSMASPHVAGVVAAMLDANATLTVAQIRSILQRTGECPVPIGTTNATGGALCRGQGQWTDDSDGFAEPLVNAKRAVEFVVDLGPGPVNLPPTASFTQYCDLDDCTFSDTSTDFETSVNSWTWAFGDGSFSSDQNPTHAYASTGVYTVALDVTDTTGKADSTSIDVQVPTPYAPAIQGDWVGKYGGDGYALAAWLGNGTSDLVSFSKGTVGLDNGTRFEWASSTSDVRALEDPGETIQRAATWYDETSLQLSMNFNEAYAGGLHLYAVDWGGSDRRQTVTVDDGSGPQVVEITTGFNDGAWMHFPIDVQANGTVTIAAANDGGDNAVLSGLFLGEDTGGEPPPPPPPPPSPGVQGDWAGVYGADGYVLSAFDAGGGSDLVDWPKGTVSLDTGTRFQWEDSTTDTRALEHPEQTLYRPAAWYDATAVEASILFSEPYTGDLHLYAVDWGGSDRRQTVVVNDGSGPQVAELDTAFNAGAWMHFTLDVLAGDTVTITATRVAGGNALISGIFLGGEWDATEPPAPPPPPGPGVQGDWSGVYGADGYALGAFEGDGSGDLVSWPKGSVALIAGDRHEWKNTTSDVRALESPDESFNRAAGWYQKNDLELEVTFDEAYTGDLHVYSVDWGGTKRRQTVTVDDGNGPQTVALTSDFNAGAWMHFTVDVGAGDTVSVMSHRDAGANATISGLFLGDAWTPPDPPPPPPPPPPTPSPEAQGDWVGVYGADGYALGGYLNDGASDLVSFPKGTIALTKGQRYQWDPDTTTDVRALEDPAEGFYRASTWYHKTQLTLTITFDEAYEGGLHLYAFDWNTHKRRQTVTVDDGRGPQAVSLTSSFKQGAWMHFTVDVEAGDTVTIVVDKSAGANATIAGLFLG